MTRQNPVQSPAAAATLVVVPAYNEEASIAAVVRSIIEAAGLPVLVVNDASGDNTAAEARAAGADVMSLAVQLGPWGAIQAGLRYARRHGFEVVLTMDGDGQHPAEPIAAVLGPVLDGSAEVAIGACPERGSKMRRIAWRLMRLSSSLSLSDLTSGFRAYGPLALEYLSGEDATLLEYPDIGVLLLLHTNGLRIVDVPVEMQPRSNGSSRVFKSWLVVGFYMWQTLLLGLSKRPLSRPASRGKPTGIANGEER